MPEAIPPLLKPYVFNLPQYSLTLVTSVLGATSNWLLLRFLHSVLGSSGRGTTSEEGFGTEDAKVILISFLRGLEFWKAESRRLGLDLQRLTSQKRFAFVDGLTSLFLPPNNSSPTRLSGGGATLEPAKKLRWMGKLDEIERDILSVVESLRGSSDDDAAASRVFLIIDAPDALLATTADSTTAQSLTDMLMALRQRVYATVVTSSADGPLIHHQGHDGEGGGGGGPTPLEVEHKALVVGLAHQSRLVLQLRGLETGVAKDVSGVLRASFGGKWNGDGESEGSGDDGLEGREVLYFVQGDGGVRVFGRGE